MQASKAIFPKAIMILTFLSKSISCLKYLKQVLSSKGVVYHLEAHILKPS